MTAKVYNPHGNSLAGLRIADPVNFPRVGSMAEIVWQTEYKELTEAFSEKRLPKESRGGFVYEYSAALHLAKLYQVRFDPVSIRKPGENSFSYWNRLRKNAITGDVFIKSPSVITHGRRSKGGVNIGLIHHIYIGLKKSSLKGRLSLLCLHMRLRSLDGIVTVSRYWADYLARIGCRNINVIYNAFDAQEFVFSHDEMNGFVRTLGLPADRPILYIGLANPQKGVLDICDALKNEGYTLVTSGPPAPDLMLPTQHLFLERRDYLRLLKASDVVITMSKIEEGWSRVAHEAMLCRTPVIGSGTGGMRELLEGGGQIVCRRISDLADSVRGVLARKEELGSKGYDFAKRFDENSFEQQWSEFIQNALALRRGRQ